MVEHYHDLVYHCFLGNYENVFSLLNSIDNKEEITKSEFLIDIKINHFYVNNTNPLLAAIQNNQFHIVRLLVDNGFKISNLVYLIQLVKKDKIIQYNDLKLINIEELSKTSFDKFFCLVFYSCIYNNMKLFKFLVSFIKKHKLYCLYSFIEVEKIHFIKYVLSIPFIIDTYLLKQIYFDSHNIISKRLIMCHINKKIEILPPIYKLICSFQC